MKKFGYLLSVMMVCGGCLFGCGNDTFSFFSSNYDNRPQQSVERVESVVGDVPERLVSIVGRKLFDDNLLGSQMVFGLDGNDIESFFQIVE